MKVTLERINKDVLFRGVTEDGMYSYIDGTPDVGGVHGAPRPMQTLLMAIAGCSSIDVIDILKKMRQKVDDYRVEITGRRADTVPKIFIGLHLHFFLSGTIKEKKAKQAIEMSLEKYCSVLLSMSKDIQVTYDVTINTGL